MGGLQWHHNYTLFTSWRQSRGYPLYLRLSARYIKNWCS